MVRSAAAVLRCGVFVWDKLYLLRVRVRVSVCRQSCWFPHRPFYLCNSINKVHQSCVYSSYKMTFFCVFTSESGQNVWINTSFLQCCVCLSCALVTDCIFTCFHVLFEEVSRVGKGLFTSVCLLYHSAFTWQVFTTTPFLRPSAKWCRSSSLSSPPWRTSSTSSFLWVKSRTNLITGGVIYVYESPPATLWLALQCIPSVHTVTTIQIS